MSTRSSPWVLTTGTLSISLALLSLLVAGGGAIAIYRAWTWAADQPGGHGGPQGIQWFGVIVLAFLVLAVVAVLEVIGLVLGCAKYANGRVLDLSGS